MAERKNRSLEIQTNLERALSLGNEEQFRELLANWVNDMQAQEKEVIADLASTHNADFLPFEGEGHRTNGWFEEEERLFSPGYARNSVVTAVYHPEVGIGGTHRSFLTVEDALTTAVRSARNPELRRSLLKADSSAKIWMILAAPKLDKVFQLAISVAIQQGLSLSQKIFSKPDVTMAVYGMDFLPGNKKPFMEYASDVTQNHLTTRGLPTKNLVFNFNRLGQAASLLYGGANHPIYSRPTFINQL